LTVINWGNAAGAAAAACQLGLTTQVPATVEVAAPGKVPEPVPGVRFTARPFIRRERELSPTEVAVLEVLREPLLAEASLEEVGRRIQRLVDVGQVRPQLIASSLADEHNLQARRHWAGMAGRL
jgi:hypothetical protein